MNAPAISCTLYSPTDPPQFVNNAQKRRPAEWKFRTSFITFQILELISTHTKPHVISLFAVLLKKKKKKALCHGIPQNINLIAAC